MLVAEELKRDAGVEFGIINPAAAEPAVLIMFDEAVVGVSRKGERAETQRVHSGQLQQPHFWFRRSQMWQIECDQIVSQQEGRAFGGLVQLRQGSRESASGMCEAESAIPAHGPESMDAAVSVHLQIEGKARRLEGVAWAGSVCHVTVTLAGVTGAA